MDANFGDNLRFWRRRLNFSQNELAKRSGISPVTIGQIETGKRKARRDTIQKLIDGLGITESQLLGISPPAPEKPAPVEVVSVKEERKVSAEKTIEKPHSIVLSNLDLEIINRVLNLNFDGKITVLKHLKVLE